MAEKAVVLDFTNVKDGGGEYNRKHYPEGDYVAKVTGVKTVPVKKDPQQKQWEFKISVKSGTYAYYCQFTENTLWKIRNLFIAAGIGIPKKRLKVDPAKILGRAIGVTLTDHEYDGKMFSQIDSVFPASEVEGDDVDDEEPDDEEEEDEEEVETEAEEEDEEDEDEEPEPPKAKKKDKKGKKSKGKRATEDVDEDELEELDIEEI